MNKDNLEIERKFLLKNVPTFTEKIDILLIHQIYVKIGGENRRFRKTLNTKTQEEVFHQCVKKDLSPGVFEEIEKEITEKKFNEMESRDHSYIMKKRYVHKENGLKWEIDEYLEIKMVTLEVELDSIKQKIKIPKFIKNLIIVELTGKKEFSNYRLSLKVKK